jgi:hypothetical protein
VPDDHRDRWTALLARLTSGFVRAIPDGGSPAWARLPGPDMPGHPSGDRTSGMEGFTRMSVAWAALVAGPGATTLTHDGVAIDVLDLLVRGLADGTDPAGPWYWGDIGDHDQRIVEAAEVAFAMWLARHRLLPALGEDRLERVLAWLGQVHGRTVYDDNWVLFPVAVALLGRGLGRPIDDRLIDGGLDRMLAWDVGDGWYADGEGHAFDRYTGWAVHWHLLHWAGIDGDRRPDVRDRVRAAAATWLRDLPAWAAADGAIPFLGRSLGYRFATASLAGLAAVQGHLPIDPGLARGIIDRNISYHLDRDAIDPQTDWFRIGVWGRRPEVCERYMRAGASAWAVHALLPLALAADHPFWRAPDPGLPGLRRPRPDPDVDLVLRGPGYLVGHRQPIGESWVASALMDHPNDIPGHDYRPTYGKWLYHSAFPLARAAADGRPGPDGVMLLEGATGGIGHRELVADGGAGPDWTWTRHAVAVDGATHDVTTVSIRDRDLWVRASGLRPSAPVRAVAGSLPLGVADAAAIRRAGDPATGAEAATDGTRWVAIRALAGFDRTDCSCPARGGADRNLVAPHSEQPTVVEERASAITRLLAHADVARVGDRDPLPDLAAITVVAATADTLTVRLPSGELAHLAAGATPPTRVELAGWTFLGPALHVVRAGPDGAWLASEAVLEVPGAFRLDAPGPVEVRRLAGGGVLVGTTEAIELDPAWVGDGLSVLSVLEHDGWRRVGELVRPGAVDAQTIEGPRERTGHRFLWLRVDRS